MAGSLRRTGPPARRTRLAARSTERRQSDARRAALAHAYLGALCRIRSEVCTRDAENWHELVGQGQGGSREDPRNLVPCCDLCNGWIEDNPREAYERGWKVPRHEAVEGTGGLVPAVPSPYAIANDPEEAW